MAQYDVQQVCENGHKITGVYRLKPDVRKDFCPTCGAKTLTTCPGCSAEIQGDRIEEQWHGLWESVEYAPVLSHCGGCGKPYPWAEKINTTTDTTLETEKVSYGNDVFIVHGHNERVKLDVARFIERLSLNPLILHEQPNQGRTIIEKFEDYSNVGFAVVLLTGDDVGAPVSRKSDLKSRARQNVILELGFFLGKLGREHVCALYEKGVDIPTDYEGVLYIPLSGDWKFLLAREIKAAGIKIDLNNAI